MTNRVAMLMDSHNQVIHCGEISTDPHVPHGIRWFGRFFYFDGENLIGSALLYREGTLLELTSGPPGDR